MSLEDAKSAHFIAKIAYIVFVLIAIESASTVDEQATGFENVPDVVQDVPLSLLTHPDIVKAPLFSGVLILAKHPFA